MSGSGVSKTMAPYHPPADPSRIRHVALASKSFRVFGLKDKAWRDARADWRKYKSGLHDGGVSNNSGGSNTNSGGGGNANSGGGRVGLKSALKKPSRGAANNGGGVMAAAQRSVRGGLSCGNVDDVCSDEETDSGDDEDDDVVPDAIDEEPPRDAGMEEEEELAQICEAVTTALAEDAGGFGTAGFHVSRADCVRLLSNLDDDNASPAAFSAELVPHDADSNTPMDPTSLLLVDEETGEFKFMGNDESYLTQKEGILPFQLRVNVSRAREGLAAKAYHQALFAGRKGAGNDDELFGGDDWVTEDEKLSGLRQRLIDAREHAGEEKDAVDGEGSALGYYVELLLVDPLVPLDEAVIAPPSTLDRASPNAKTLSSSFRGSSSAMHGLDDSDDEDIAPPKNAFVKDIYSSQKFANPGPWERANTKAFGDVGLDLRKALVRVEFPVFPEGCKEKTFREVYQLNARLKSGSFATVCRGTHRATGKKIAVKCVLRKDLPPSDDSAIYDEVLILSTLRHPYICPLVDFFEERECYFLVMELMSGGDLFDRIGKRKSYTENDARDLCRKMLESVRYCHENSVAHCDMKPKNLLLVSDDDDVQMKLADFGFATRVYSPNSLTKQCGTPFFVAPEVLMRSPYDQQSDMWSCGVIMFLLLGGDLPFMGRSQKELFRNIVMGRYEFEEDGWAHVSPEARDLVRRLLVTDPSKRLTSREAMASTWMRSRGNALAKNNLQYTSQRLRGFNARMKLRASMITVRSTVSLRFSIASLKAGREASSSSAGSSGEKAEAKVGEMGSKQPSFLKDLPAEGSDDEEED